MSDTSISLYRCGEIIQQIEAIAEANDGEITEEQLGELVRAQTTSLAKLGGLCRFMRHLEAYVATGKAEIERIRKITAHAQCRLDSVKKFLTPYVESEQKKFGYPLDVDTFRLSVRRSKAVVITDPEGFAAGSYPSQSTTKTIHVPDKKVLKEYLETYGPHPGAEIQNNVNLQMK
ncbi:MAG TPA: siphovirus Gp157 family protein [Sedimentisphaerales bacterium]|nr:siphovirus Gp157 family protein [Sedimentisphaerales bacterium]